MDKIKGTVLRVFAKDVNTDEIISGKYKYDELDIKKLAVHTFEAIDSKFYEDAKKVKNPILIASENFGCGSSREQAPWVIKALRILQKTRHTSLSQSQSLCRNYWMPAD
jgi:3-isopropylmalate/(R)-2-methylmalate dehydratase small subunit